ncbi:MAG: M15 family metallopeptidase [Lachnospiraceae bacterium]
MLQVSLVILVIGLLAGGFVGYTIKAKQSQKIIRQKERQLAQKEVQAKKVQDAQKKQEKQEKEKKKEIPWNLQLINEAQPMDPAFVPELVSLNDEYSVDKRIVESVNQLLEAAKTEGLAMHICSAYRSIEKQQEVFNTTIAQNLNEGTDYLTAYNTTRQSVALPGTSEHGLGLALDIVSEAYQELDTKQAETPESQWLAKNAAKYGFILRYPPEKSAETRIIYEPWHYRYVGVEDATKIMGAGVTLEQYLKDNY